MRRYEQIYILRQSLSEDEINQVVENSNQIVLDDEGTIISLNKWGMRKLAYPIKKEPQGYYVLADVAATPAAVAEIERKFRIDDAVLKYLTVKVSDSMTAEEISEAQNAAASQAAESEAAEDSSAVDEGTASPEPETKPAPTPAEKTEAEPATVETDDVEPTTEEKASK
jgi:small subunit ribosomal protein S6